MDLFVIIYYMGAAQSVNYPGEVSSNAVDNNLPIINLRETPVPTIDANAANNLQMSNQLQRSLATKKTIVKSHFKALQEKLESTLKMHLLFDNYENKNSVIIKDLDKKLIIQQKELKDLKESNSKIRQLIDYDRENIDKNSTNKKIVFSANILLSITLLILIILILKKKGLLDPILNKLKPPM